MIQFKRSVLIVEDDEDLREILQDILQRFGLNIQMATDGDMALKMLKQIQFDLVLSDISMPIMNGLSLLEELRNDSTISQPRFCFMSAGIDESDVKLRFLSGKFDGILAKPFSRELIHAKLCELFPDN